MKRPNTRQIREAWLFCFLLGIILINYPFIQIFNKDTLIFGFPPLFLYFVIGWPIAIFIVFLFSKHLRMEDQPGDSNGEKSEENGQE